MASSAATIEQQFVSFAKFGDPKADGKTMTLTKSDRWLKQAEILDDDHITLTDTGVIFNKFKCSYLNYSDYMKYLRMLCAEKELDFDSVKEKLVECGAPGVKEAENAVVQTT